MRKKTISTLLAMSLLLGTAYTATADPLTDTQKQELQQNQQKLDEVNSKINTLTDKIDELTAKIQPLVWEVEENENKIKDINGDIDIIEREIEDAKQNLEEKQEAFGDRMRAIYKSGGNTSYLSIVLSSKSLGEMISNIQVVGTLMKIDKDVMTEIQKEKDSLDQKVEELQKKEDEIVSINEENNKKIEELNVLKEDQQKDVDALNEEKKKIVVNLADSERPMLDYPISIIKKSSSSVSDLKAAIEMLREVRKDIKTDEIDKECVKYIEQAKEMVAEKEAPTGSTGSSSSGVNRGDTPTSSPTVSGSASSLLSYAYKFIGRPYVYGATGPNSFDCSGFTSYVYRNALGIEIGRTTWNQAAKGQPVSYSNLQPGDLVFTNSTGHVGIYVGNGQMIHAPRTGETIKVGPIYKFSGARRILK